ncbi:MAG: YjcZ family sporulation protein [Bacilli bacterium]
MMGFGYESNFSIILVLFILLIIIVCSLCQPSCLPRC